MTTRLVILGASGDLTGRYLLPAVAQLEEAKRCPDIHVVGAAQEAWDTETFRKHARDRLELHADDVTREARDRVLAGLTYVQADVTERSSLRAVFPREAGDTVVYLALPPALFAPTIEAVGDLAPPGTRLVVEKPFATDLQSARALNALLHRHFPEDRVFRMDHFLGKQTVQNVLGLRFANRVFDPLWCAAHVECVEIVWDETVGLEKRARYYDRTGALRDMVQNHLLQLVALVGMERPRGPGAEDLRDAKAEVLKRVRHDNRNDAVPAVVRGRYTRGRVGDREVPDYVAEPGVDPANETETFVEVTLFVDTERWEGVPFRLRTGKALAKSRREIHIHFRDMDPMPFAPQHDILPNRLMLGLDPDRMALDIALNGAGDPFSLEPARLDTDLAPQDLSAYARLLLDVFEGDPALSIRGDEAEESWRIVEPILDSWKSGRVPLHDYAAGSTGPQASLTQ